MSASVAANDNDAEPPAGRSAPPAASDRAASSTPVHFAGGRSDSGWIPFEYLKGSQIHLPITINGHPTIAQLDSGATSHTVDTALATKIGLRSERTISGQGFGGSEAMSIAHVTITAGAMTITNSEAVVFDHETISKAMGHSSYVTLGGDAFRHAVVDIDFKHRRLAFRDPSRFVAPAHAQELPLTGRDIRSLPVTVDGRPVRMQFDLGNGRAALLYQKYWKAAYPGNRRTATTYSGGSGGFNVQKFMMLDEVRVGTTVFRDVPTLLQEGKGDLGGDQFDGNIGIGLLGRFHLIVDFPHNRAFFAPPIDRTTPFQVNHTGLTLFREGDTMVVKHIAPGSPAAGTGLKVDDRITAVEEGRARRRIDLTSAWTMLPVDRTLYLNLADGREVTMVTARYF